jgi:TPR repeat protein
MGHNVYLANSSAPSGSNIKVMEWPYEMPLLLQPLLISGGVMADGILYYDAKPGIAQLERFYSYLVPLVADKHTFAESKHKLFSYLHALPHPYFSMEPPDGEQAAVWQADIAFNNAVIMNAMDSNDLSLLDYSQFKHVSTAFHSFAELLNYPDYAYGWGVIYDEPTVFNEQGLWGLKSTDGTILLPARFDEFYAFSGHGIAVVRKGQQYGYVHRSGKIITPAEWDEAYDLDYAGLAIVQREGLYGLVDSTGKVVAAPIFDLIIRKAPPQGFAWGFKGPEVYLVDQYGISRANKALVQQDVDNAGYNDVVRDRLLAYVNIPDDGPVTDAYTPVEELYNIGVDAYNRQDYPAAIYHYTMAAEKGYGYAMNNLAHIFYMVDGYTDDDKAFYWYQQGADAGNTNAVNGLSLCYQYGIGTAPDIDKAIDLLLRAAEEGLAAAHNNLGFLLYETDPGRALYHYQQAAQLGEPDYGWLGYLHEEKGEYETAFRYYQQDTSETGAFNQGNLLRKGLGTAKDIKAAIGHFKTAIAGGYDRGHIELASIYLSEEGFIDRDQAKIHIAAAEKAGLDIPGDIHPK